jgi:hypothetical protein
MQADAVKKLYQGKLTAFAESPDWTVGVQFGCRRGDLNDAVTRVFERRRTASSGREHGVRGRAFRSRTLHAAGRDDGRLANH